MADDPTENIIADSFALWVAETTDAAPADVTTAMGTVDTGWKLCGLMMPDGIGMNSDPQITELFSAGYKEPTDTVKTREPKRFTAQLQQWNTHNLILALNGGTVAVASGTSTYTPPSNTALNEKSLTFEYEVGSFIWRIYMPRVQVRSGLQIGFPTNDYTVLPLDVTLLVPSGGGASYKIITNNVTAMVAS